MFEPSCQTSASGLISLIVMLMVMMMMMMMLMRMMMTMMLITMVTLMIMMTVMPNPGGVGGGVGAGGGPGLARTSGNESWTQAPWKTLVLDPGAFQTTFRPLARTGLGYLAWP